MHIREPILKAEADLAGVHNVLSKAPFQYGFPFESLLERADRIYEDIPIERLLVNTTENVIALVAKNE